jgi:hypothetical protein
LVVPFHPRQFLFFDISEWFKSVIKTRIRFLSNAFIDRHSNQFELAI